MLRTRFLVTAGVRLLVTAGIDNTKAVALGVGENHKIGTGFVPVPVDTFGTESDQSLHLGGLIGGVARVQVRVYPGMIPDRRFAPGQRQSRAGPAVGRHQPFRAAHAVQSAKKGRGFWRCPPAHQWDCGGSGAYHNRYNGWPSR